MCRWVGIHICRSLDDHFTELAHHYSHSANTWQAVKYLHLAGEQALQRWANLEAINYLKKGLELLGSPPDAAERSRPTDEAQRCSLLLLLGQAQWHAGKFLESHETLLRAADVPNRSDQRRAWPVRRWSW